MSRRVGVGDGEGRHRVTLLRPPKKSCREKLKSFFWDKQEKTCFTRTPMNWVSIFFYYIIFLLGVFLIFQTSMKLAEFIAAVQSDRPQYILGDSPIGSSPGLNFFPIRDDDNLIWLSDDRSYREYVDFINSELDKYRERDPKFDPTSLGLCGTAPYGYDTKTPCIFLRINKLIMWKPKPYQKNDSLPDEVPNSVRNLIETSPDSRIWVTCEGTTAKDRDHISDSFFEFQGTPGFDPTPFPYDRQEAFVDPIVAVLFKDDTEPNGVIYSFTCTAWSKGLDTSVASVDVPYFIE